MTTKPSYTPALRFPDFFNDGEWEVKQLGEIAKTFSGGTPSAHNKNYYGGDIPFIRSGEINSDHTELFLTQEGLDNSSAKMVEKGTILYALYGATSGEVGIAQMNGAINQAILAIIPKEGIITAFLYQYLKSQKSSIVNLYIQGGQGNLSGAIINSLNIPLPPLAEQRRIAACLSALDEMLAATNGKLEQLKAYKKGLMQQLFANPMGGVNH
ncbi:MAG: restriction endonuclease subunit S [Prevotella sp.]|nr:restriction endonuclease subunit S [Prevotella sp.]